MPRTGARPRAVAAALAVVALLAACSATDGGAVPAGSPGRTEAGTAATPSSGPTYLPEGKLPGSLSLRDVDAQTVRARPFADFAVAAGDGVWVTGVGRGMVRYDATGAVTARVALPGDVPVALAADEHEVVVPIGQPALLLRVDSRTGEELARVRLPGAPLGESAVGLEDGVAYVLADPMDPRIFVVDGDRIVDELEVPGAAVAVRAAFGSLWVPTATSTLDRYSLRSRRWESIPVGPFPRFLDVGLGAVWVMDQGDGSVSVVDGHTGAVEQVAGTGTGISGGDLTFGGGAAWLRTDSQVLRIDPDSRTVTHVLDLPPGSGSAAATDRVLVVTNHDHDAVHVVPLPLPQS